MDAETQNEMLLNFFKALSDASRLKIVGLLAQRSHTVQELAEVLGRSVSTTSNHLAMLTHAGLVSARPDGHYYVYSLETETLRGMARTLLAEDSLPKLSQETEAGDAFERKVLASFTDSEGRITAFPAQEKKFLVLVRHVLKAFETGKRYTEKQVNEILSFYSEDTALLRRSLVEYKFMARQGGGGEYWRVDE